MSSCNHHEKICHAKPYSLLRIDMLELVRGTKMMLLFQRKFLERRRVEEDNITQMEEEEREVYLNQLTAEERSKNIKLTEKHCR